MTKYITDSELTELNNRTGELNKEKDWIRKTFLPAADECENYCGNVRVVFKKGVAKLTADSDREEKYVSSFLQISSALALYRAISLFRITRLDKNQDYYKCNWSITLKHEPTGTFLVLGEWKGGFNIFTNTQLTKDFPPEFVKDVERFLTAFVSVDLTIDYDGTRAGCIA